MMFEVTTGKLPYEESSIFKLALAVGSEAAAPRADDHNPEVPPDVAALMARCLKKIADERPTAAAVVAELRRMLQHGASLSGQESPFRGLLPFTEEHATFFFGREPELAGLCERVRLTPVLPVVGPSGAGKSSFVHAGLVP